MAVSKGQIEAFYKALALKQRPHLASYPVKFELQLSSSYIFEARRRGSQVKLTLNFLPGKGNWEDHFSEALRAVDELRTAVRHQTPLVAVRQPTNGPQPTLHVGPCSLWIPSQNLLPKEC